MHYLHQTSLSLTAGHNSGSPKNCILRSLSSFWGRTRAFAIEVKVSATVYARLCLERARGTNSENSSREGMKFRTNI